jgi:hypothetical protein
MSEQWWHKYLKESGFSGVDVALRSHQHERYHAYSAMVSTASGKLHEKLRLKSVVIVIDQPSHQ